MTPGEPAQTALHVPALESGVTRIFSLDPTAPALTAILPPHPLDAGHVATLLGLSVLREGQSDRIAIKDLGDLTLSEFLRIGHDARSDDLAAIAPTLDALGGHVLLVHSLAFDGRATTLSPNPGLSFMGAFRRNDAPPAPLTLPEQERPEILARPAGPQPSGRPLGALVTLALLALAALVLLYTLF